MYSCFGSGSSPGRLNSINSGRPPGIQKILSGYPVSPGVTSLEPTIPRCFHVKSTASRSIFDSLMGACEGHGKEHRRHSQAPRPLTAKTTITWAPNWYLGRLLTSFLDDRFVPWSITIELAVYLLHHLPPRRCLKISSAWAA